MSRAPLNRWWVAFGYGVFLACNLLAVSTAFGQATALDTYVAADDDVYSWELVTASEHDGYVAYVLELTSQQWRSASEVDRPIWKHWLTIVRPTELRFDKAFLFIGGGSNREAAPETPSERVVQMALGSGTVVAELGTVPNQPLYFSDRPDVGRSEDDLVAYSRMQYIETHDPKWLVRLPMVKSGVRAMDAIEEFMATEQGGGVDIDGFVVAGASKRGWTTWLVGVVDSRVIAMVPLVIDALNTQAITRHQYAAYGFFSPALNDYVRHGLYPDKVGTQEYKEILDIEDPYNYRQRERMRIPKFVVNSAGDQFFTPDNAQYYYHDLPEEKHLRYVPNTKHNLAGSDVSESVLAFYLSVLEGQPRPKMAWKREADGELSVSTKDTPERVVLWQATNPEARDFRLDTIGKAYKSSPVEPSPQGEYRVSVETPPEGYTAYFVEMTFPTAGPYPLKFTTEVFVVPDVLPFESEAPVLKSDQ